MNIIIVYSSFRKNLGSSIMRGEQLLDILQKNLSEYATFEYKPLANFKNKILVLTKWSIYELTLKQLANLKQSNILIFDPVDSEVSSDKLEYADIVISCCEYSYLNYLKKLDNKPCFLVDHHSDPRIQNIKSKILTNSKIGYFGRLENTIITEKIVKRVKFFTVDGPNRSDTWLYNLKDYNIHYIIRNLNGSSPKPFTKGFVAANSDANVIAHEDQHDAIRWLGDDYPYLIKGKLTEYSILEMIDYTKSTYGTDVWDRALNKMKNIKESLTDVYIAQQFKLVIKKALELI